MISNRVSWLFRICFNVFTYRLIAMWSPNLSSSSHISCISFDHRWPKKEEEMMHNMPIAIKYLFDRNFSLGSILDDIHLPLENRKMNSIDLPFFSLHFRQNLHASIAPLCSNLLSCFSNFELPFRNYSPFF